MQRKLTLLNAAMAAHLLAAAAAAQGPTVTLLQPPIIEGRISQEDRRFAMFALGVRPGQAAYTIDAERLNLGLTAIRLTDRFKDVSGAMEDAEGGKIYRVYLEPWPKLKSVGVDAPPWLKKKIKPWLQDIRRGARPGDFAIDSWISKAEDWLKVWGYPSPSVEVARDPGAGDSIKIAIDPGEPDLISRIELSGDFGSVGRDLIYSDLNRLLVKPKANWTPDARRIAVNQLNRRFAKGGHLFARVSDWSYKDGALSIEISAGPVVSLAANTPAVHLFTAPAAHLLPGLVAIRASGPKLRARQLKKQLALPSVDRFGADLLSETSRRLTGTYLDDGRPFTAVSHMPAQIGPLLKDGGRLHLQYNINYAGAMSVAKVEIKGNVELSEAALLKETSKILPDSFYSRKRKAAPEYAEACLTRILNYGVSLGYADISARHEWRAAGKDKAVLQITVNEGKRQTLKEVNIALALGAGRQRERDALIKALEDYFDKTAAANMSEEALKTKNDWIARVEGLEPVGNDTYRLAVRGQAPFIKQHVAALRSVVQQALSANGITSPMVSIRLESDESSAVKVWLGVPDQNPERLRRVVVQGADQTKADFILDEMRPTPDKPGIRFGQPLVVSSISGARASLGSLGIFSSVDARSITEATSRSSAGPSLWGPGDMMIRLKERPLWNYTGSFSYDRAVGYQLGAGAQRINIGGQARTLDFSLRAGDGTINSPDLRSVFPTGDPTRSLDVYSVGYTDPWFETQPLSGVLAGRALLRGDASYIRERQSAYLIHRRRYTSSLEWGLRESKWGIKAARLGYRFENVGVVGPDEAEMQGEVGSPAHSILSIPYIQLVRDTRDNLFDPKKGSLFVLQFDAALRTVGTSPNSSFFKVDLRYGWNHPVGEDARFGVASLAARLGIARPTASTSQEMPLSERFFGGGPNSHRGVEPDQLGPFGVVYDRELFYPYNPKEFDDGRHFRNVPVGGQAIALVNLDYRFPLPIIGQWVWWEMFVDSGEVYSRIRDYKKENPLISPFPHWRTSAGAGLILRLGGFPIKIEYSWDVRRLLGKEDVGAYSDYIKRTRLKTALVSVGFQL
jgi:outer membrane protein assembly factor BamA